MAPSLHGDDSMDMASACNPSLLEEPVRRLVETLWEQGVRDQRVLAAIARVPRDRFVLETDHERAWENVALPIDAGQTISQPYIVGLMSQSLNLSKHERVLEIGTGSGYQAAVLSLLADRVISIERHDNLAQSAAALLLLLGFDNVQVMVGDGTLGFPDEAPYDGILIAAGAPQVPEPLLRQLSPEGGRLVIPIGTLEDQRLYLYQRHGVGLEETDLGPVRFVPLLGASGWTAPIPT